MPTVSADRLTVIAVELLKAAGAGEGEAAVVAGHCVGANLAGHDSHGVYRVPGYIEGIRRGDVVPGAAFEVVRESATTTVVDGHWGFGQVVSERAMRITIDKAREHDVAAATVFRQGHVGRLTDYPLMAAEAGLMALMTADSGRGAKSVVPFGGREPRLGTNPICIAIPSNLDGPLYIDIATSAVAGGKIGVAAARGAAVREGWIVDKDGRPTTDPGQLARGGAMLPLGGSEGHKGYGLSVMVEVLSGILTGLGFGVSPSGRHNDGCFMAAFNIAAFRPLDEFKQEVSDFARYLKSTPPAEGFTEVFYPGEPEFLMSRRRRAEGIFVEEATWGRLSELASDYGLAVKLGLG